MLFSCRVEIQIFLTKTNQEICQIVWGIALRTEFPGMEVQKHASFFLSGSTKAFQKAERDVPKQQSNKVEIIQVGAVKNLPHLAL